MEELSRFNGIAPAITMADKYHMSHIAIMRYL